MNDRSSTGENSPEATDRINVSVGELRSDLLQIFLPGQGIDVLVAAPGHLGSFPGMNDIHTSPDRRIPSANAFAFRTALLSRLASDIDELPQTPEWEAIICTWVDALDTGAARCLHFVSEPLFTRMISTDQSTVICPAPITVGVVEQQRELVLELHGAEHQRAREWFEKHASASVDVSGEVREVLTNSWAGGAVTPSDLYYKVLSEYFWTTVEELDLKADDNPMLEQLTQFQLEAYEYAKGILRRYGAVFLADVVGLGKTFIALALLRHLQDRYGEHAVVVGPPNVLGEWQALAAEFRIELQTVSIGKLEDLDALPDREILVIDESHNFRNVGTQRYGRIQNWLRPDGAASSRKVLLVSATPQNNHPNDIKHQLAFFPDQYNRLPFRGESLDAWFADVQSGRTSLTELLQHVVVRRTRTFIKTAYPDATLRVREVNGAFTHVPLKFPERRSGEEQCLRYSINETYGGDLYAQILDTLRDLSYAPYTLASYLSDEGKEDPRVSGIQRAGSSVRGLYKVLLLKRLESSVPAFRNTLSRFHTRLTDCLELLDAGQVTVRVQERASTAVDDDVIDLISEDRTVPASLFDHVRLRTDVTRDLEAVTALDTQMQTLDRDSDGKMKRLREYLSRRDPRAHRTIIFTQFADTAEYLGEMFGQSYGRTAVVTGARGNAMTMARRFSPVSSRVDVSEDQQIDLLISTDALSEGVNLQDADTLVNYDLHWNPVRLIQRAGRIDRIGSHNDVIDVASFLPEAALESALGLETVLRRRIQEFLEVFGDDSHVLPSDDQLDPEAAASAFTGSALDDAEDDMDGLSRHVERLLQLRREDPQEYARILELRPGRHATSSSTAEAVVGMRLGWFWRFWRKVDGNSLETVDDLRGLDTFYRHAQAGAPSEPVGHNQIVSKITREARELFEPMAAAFREQRLRPQLSAPETFVLERLETYKRNCIASRRPLVDQLIDWVRGGVAQMQLRRYGRIWKRDSLPAETIFNETRVLYSRFPPAPEEFGSVQLAGTVVGSAPE